MANSRKSVYNNKKCFGISSDIKVFTYTIFHILHILIKTNLIPQKLTNLILNSRRRNNSFVLKDCVSDPGFRCI